MRRPRRLEAFKAEMSGAWASTKRTIDDLTTHHSLLTNKISHMSASESIQQAAWRRLKKNSAAVFGMVVIVLALLLALLA